MKILCVGMGERIKLIIIIIIKKSLYMVPEPTHVADSNRQFVELVRLEAALKLLIAHPIPVFTPRPTSS